MDYWSGAVLWDVMALVLASVNMRRFEFRWPMVYWGGIVVFCAAGNVAAYYHKGTIATLWFTVSMAGLAITMLGTLGIPPRRPPERRRR